MLPERPGARRWRRTPCTSRPTSGRPRSSLSAWSWFDWPARVGQPWLIRADAVAALGVAGIVVFVSLQLGKRTVAALLDSAPEGVRDRLMEAAQVPGVVEVRQARLRQSGPESFADLTLAIGPGTSLERAHDIASAAEAAVERLIPGVDVVVHLEPTDHATDSVVEVARRVAARQGLGAHSIRLLDIPGRCTMELHLEVPDHLSLEAAHVEATPLRGNRPPGSTRDPASHHAH